MAISNKTAAAATAIAEVVEVLYGVSVVRIGRTDPDELVLHLADGSKWAVSCATPPRVYKDWTGETPSELEVDPTSVLGRLAAKYAATFSYS